MIIETRKLDLPDCRFGFIKELVDIGFAIIAISYHENLIEFAITTVAGPKPRILREAAFQIFERVDLDVVELKVIDDLYKLVAEKALDLLIFLVKFIFRKLQLSTFGLSLLSKMNRNILIMVRRRYFVISVFLNGLFQEVEFAEFEL